MIARNLEKNGKNIGLVIFSLLIILGIFFRVWNFDAWVHVKADQVRDAKMISHSFSDGPGELPLLGPKAGGTDLRLGPIFYYFQYLSGLIFGSASPPVLAYPNLLFSLLAIPLFFFFFRLFFSKFISASLTAVFSSSFLAVEYSRFAWNPNSTVFFSLLFFYALLQIFSETGKRKRVWIGVAALAFSVASQLHFVSLLGLSTSTFFFLLFRRKEIGRRIDWKDLIIFSLIVLFFYIPVILSDIITQGNNFKQFLEALSGKSSGGSFIKNVWKDAYYFGQYFFRILTGYLGGNKIWHYFGMLITFFGVIFSILVFKKGSKKNKEAAQISLAVFFGFFILFVPLADSIDKPRFYLSIFWLPLIFLGIIYEYFKSSDNFSKKSIFTFAVASFCFSNIFFNANWFWELEKSDREKLDPKKTVVLHDKKDPLWLPWGRQVKIAELFSRECPKGKIYFSSSKHIRDFWKSIEFAFYFDPKNENRSISQFKKEVPEEKNTCYFYLTRNGDSPNDYFSSLTEKKVADVGSVAVYRLKNKAEGDSQETSENDIIDESEDEEGMDGQAENEDLSDNSSEESEKVRRIYWKDVF